jgi:hypothetical protein
MIDVLSTLFTPFVESSVGGFLSSDLVPSTMMKFSEAVDGACCKKDEGWRPNDVLQCKFTSC